MEKDDFSDQMTKFQKLADAAEFYLENSFIHLHRCFESELASVIFGKINVVIDLNNIDKELIDKMDISSDAIETLSKESNPVLSDFTSDKLAQAWEISNFIASYNGYCFKKSLNLDSIELLGHITSIAFFF